MQQWTEMGNWGIAKATFCLIVLLLYNWGEGVVPFVPVLPFVSMLAGVLQKLLQNTSKYPNKGTKYEVGYINQLQTNTRLSHQCKQWKRKRCNAKWKLNRIMRIRLAKHRKLKSSKWLKVNNKILKLMKHLTHFMQLVSFYTLWKHENRKVFW